MDEEADRVLLSIEREIVIMKLIDHPNIMHLYDVWETSTDLYLILEYVEGGELFEFLERNGRLSTTDALNYFQQIIAAIEYCHKFNIAHRDLKPENLLLDKDGNIKVADFGMATWQKTNANGLLQTACGSPHYAAPEVIRGEGYDGSIADIWSCGVILFALLAARLPFDDEDVPTLLEKVSSGKFTFPASMDARAKDLITRMLERNPMRRITVPEIMKHSFYTMHKAKKVPSISPKLEEIARPLSSKAAVDPDIFGNLRTLWHGTSDEDIMAKLLNSERTWEKGVYHLLVQYRAKRLEDYDEKAEEMVRRASKRRSKRKANSSSSDRRNGRDIPPRCDPPTPQRARAAERLARVPEAVSDEDVAHSTARFLAPNGYRREPERVMAIDMEDDRTPTSAGFSVTTPRGFYSPLPGFGQSFDPSPISPNFPLTPVDPLLPSPHVVLDSEAPMSPLAPTSPIWNALNMSPPPVDVPHMQDEKVQHFFKQIMDQFNVMQAVTGSSPAGPMSPQLILSPPQPSHKFIHTIHTREAASHGDANDENENPSSIRPLNTRRSRPAPLSIYDNKENSSHFILDFEDEGEYASANSHAESRAALSDKRIQIVEPKGKLRRRKTISALDVSSDSAQPTTTAPPLSPAWFGNLFKLKPAVYALQSFHDADVTREECRRILSVMGVRAVLHSQGLGVLKCKMDEFADPGGVMSVMKAVRFRVEVQRADSAQAAAGIVTVLQLVQEKGALSTFKLIYGRLKKEWCLDAQKMSGTMDQQTDVSQSMRFAGFESDEIEVR